MKKNFRKAMALLLVCGMSCSTACLIKQKQSNEANAYVGIGYLAAKKGASAEAGAIIGVAGVWESGVWGYAVTAAFGGPAGIVAAGVVGL